MGIDIPAPYSPRVHPYQSSSMEDRQMFNASLAVNEVVGCIWRSNEAGLVLEFDFKKDYDGSVEDFLKAF